MLRKRTCGLYTNARVCAYVCERCETVELQTVFYSNKIEQPVTSAVLPARSAPVRACKAVMLEVKNGAISESCEHAAGGVHRSADFVVHGWMHCMANSSS